MLIILLLISLLSIKQGTAQKNSTNEDQICRTLIDNGGKNLQILAIGLTRNHLILITLTFEVYEVPKDSLTSTINNLYLKSKPTKMEEKYPILYNDNRFKQIKSSIFNAFILVDADSDWLIITTKYMRNNFYGLNYDITNKKVYNGLTFYGTLDEILISTNTPQIFYGLRANGGGLEMAKYSMVGATIATTRGIRLAMRYRAMCAEDDNKVKITGDRNRCPNPITWPVLKGFVEGNKFHLFGVNYIYTFDEKSFESDRSGFPVINRTYDKFFTCPGDVVQQSNASTWFPWLIIVLVLLLLLLLICLFLIRSKVVYKNSRHSKSKNFIHTKTARSGYDKETAAILTQQNKSKSFNQSKSKLSMKQKSFKSQKASQQILSKKSRSRSIAASVRTGLGPNDFRPKPLSRK
ncbi:hypothetical protein NH340_JMT03647 [Sarcoptes scabiei]|nr:hypothetical protein NH340_JMT03647 [Sarcoptes scabiei]